MGEKKEIKVRFSTVVYLFIILVLVVALGVVYYFGFVVNKPEDTKNNKIIASNTTNYKKIYDECEKQCKDVRYRRDLGEAAGYFIEDGVLYAGEKDLQNTHVNITGINGKVKYVVPLNKQTGETVVLTEEGKLYKNKKDLGFFGNSFEVILNKYSFLEILEIPNQEGLMFLTKDGKIINKEGTLYLDLLGVNKQDNTNNTNWKTIYINKLNSSKTSDDYKVEYYLTDIDGSGIPELMLEKYTSEADRKIEVYTYDNEEIVYLGDFGSSQMQFYKMNDKDYVLGVYGHMSYEETYKIYIKNNSIQKESLGDGRTISPDEGYIEGDVLIEKANLNQLYLIENYN